MNSRWISIGAFSGALAVVTGAFGAHGLKERLNAEELAWWHTAVQYHLAHALALVLCGLFERISGRRSLAGLCLLSGTVIFSGSLYAMALGAPRWFGAITPIGGVAFILGWLLFALNARRA